MIVMHTFCEDFHTVEVTKDFVSDVWEDGKISLKCKDNGKYFKDLEQLTNTLKLTVKSMQIFVLNWEYAMTANSMLKLVH